MKLYFPALLVVSPDFEPRGVPGQGTTAMFEARDNTKVIQNTKFAFPAFIAVNELR